MKKRDRIIYWIATIWLALGMLSSGVVQLLKMDEEVLMMRQLGYPPYLMTILGVWKLSGVIVILIPKVPLLKEWAYSGFFFSMSGALISHIAVSDPASEALPSVLLLVLTAVSWAFRPADRTLTSLNVSRSV